MDYAVIGNNLETSWIIRDGIFSEIVRYGEYPAVEGRELWLKKTFGLRPNPIIVAFSRGYIYNISPSIRLHIMQNVEWS